MSSRPAAAIKWGPAAPPPPSKPAPAVAPSTAAGVASLPPRSSTASSYADLSDRYLDRPLPTAAARNSANVPPTSPRPETPAQQQSARLSAGTSDGAAATRDRSADAARSTFGESAAAQLPLPSSLSGGGLLPPPDAVSRPPLWPKLSGPLHLQHGSSEVSELGAAESLTLTANGVHNDSRAGSDALHGDAASADGVMREPSNGELACHCAKHNLCWLLRSTRHRDSAFREEAMRGDPCP